MRMEDLISEIREILNNGDCSEETNMVKIRNAFSEFDRMQAEWDRIRTEQAGA